MFHHGEATKKVETTVRKRCSLFRELAPIFENELNANTVSEGEEQEEDDYEESNLESSKEEDEEKYDYAKATGGTHSMRKRQDVSDSRSGKRVKQVVLQPQSTTSISAPGFDTKQAEPHDTSVLLKSYSTGQSLW